MGSGRKCRIKIAGRQNVNGYHLKHTLKLSNNRGAPHPSIDKYIGVQRLVDDVFTRLLTFPNVIITGHHAGSHAKHRRDDAVQYHSIRTEERRSVRHKAGGLNLRDPLRRGKTWLRV